MSEENHRAPWSTMFLQPENHHDRNEATPERPSVRDQDAGQEKPNRPWSAACTRGPGARQLLTGLTYSDHVDFDRLTDADLEFLLFLANRRYNQERWEKAVALYGRARRDSNIANDDWSKNAEACLFARNLAAYRSESFDPEIEILVQGASALIVGEPSFPTDNPFAPRPASESRR